MEIEGFVVGSDKFFNYHDQPSDCKFIQTKHDLAILIYGSVHESLWPSQADVGTVLVQISDDAARWRFLWK